MSLQSRLDRLQGPPKSDEICMTSDEIKIRILDLSRVIAADDTASAESRAFAAAQVALIEGGIKAQARDRREPSYAKHLAYMQGNRPYYVPAICGGEDGKSNSMAEYHDLFKPEIMERRAALLARPDVQALIATA
jgi:hypothetical protein